MSRDDRGRDESLGWIFFSLAILGVGTMVALAAATARMGPAAIPVWGITMGCVAWAARGPIGEALAARISGKRHESETAEIPSDVYAELDDLRARMGELEERVDFSERLLVRKNGLEALSYKL